MAGARGHPRTPARPLPAPQQTQAIRNDQSNISAPSSSSGPRFHVQDFRKITTGRFSLGDIVNVHVGESCKLFGVHEKVLRKSSKFFDAAMDEKWLEGETRIVSLPEEKQLHFSAYQFWLYHREIPMPPRAALREHYSLLVQFYPLGSRLLDIDYQNAILCSIIAAFHKNPVDCTFLPTLATVDHAYANTVPADPLRKLLVAMFAKTGVKVDGMNLKEHTLDFMLDLTKTVLDPSFQRDKIRIGEDQATLDCFLHSEIDNKRKRTDEDKGDQPGAKSLNATMEEVKE